MDDGLCPKFALCCEINTRINDIIVQQNIILICKTLKTYLQFQQKD